MGRKIINYGEDERECPLLNGMRIDCYTCGDACFVAEGIAPEWSLPEGVEMTEKNRKICMECPNHIT
jgi:hypothetical protein